MAEIKISELSIGDWVEIDGAATKVWYLSQDSEVNDTTYDWVKPIPLTPEILEKNGFEEGLKNGEAYKIKVAFNQHLWLFKVEDGCWMFRLVFGLFEDFDIAKVKIKYVHQLQNALRLAGVGKEIEV